MTAFLFLPPTCDARHARRVDLANIGSLFADMEEPTSSHGVSRQVRRIAALVLIALFALGDTMLIARPEALASCLAGARHAITATTI